MNAPLDGGWLVMAEIHVSARTQQSDDLLKGGAIVKGFAILAGFLRIRMAVETHQLMSDVARRQDIIDMAVGMGAARHAALFGRLLILDEGDAAFRLDGLKAERAIAAPTRQDDPNGTFLL